MNTKRGGGEQHNPSGLLSQSLPIEGARKFRIRGRTNVSSQCDPLQSGQTVRKVRRVFDAAKN
jgi:hypothetical protein